VQTIGGVALHFWPRTPQMQVLCGFLRYLAAGSVEDGFEFRTISQLH
jgi:hypothetical protein